MQIDVSAVGTRTPVERVRWDSKDGLLYALGVGAGPSSPHLVTENSQGVEQQMVPTFATTRTADLGPIWEAAGVTDRRRLVHGGQLTEVPQPLPVDVEADLSAVLLGLHDTGKHAILEIAHEGTADGELLFRCTQTLVLRDAGGFGGQPATGDRTSLDGVELDREVSVEVPESQALLYRLSGDRNPLHSDPAIAERVGFDRPILHGLCTYGIAARTALREMLDDDPARFASFSARFTGPVYPGSPLRVLMGATGDGVGVDGVGVRVVSGDDRVVLDDGLLVAKTV